MLQPPVFNSQEEVDAYLDAQMYSAAARQVLRKGLVLSIFSPVYRG